MITYRAVDGDMLDAICHRHYKDILPSDAMPYVLNANPGLESLQLKLPEGTMITLPDIPHPEPEAAITLWD